MTATEVRNLSGKHVPESTTQILDRVHGGIRMAAERGAREWIWITDKTLPEETVKAVLSILRVDGYAIERISLVGWYNISW